MITANDPRAQFLPQFAGGMAAGVLLAVLTARPGASSLGPLAAALPFLLAALTGVAKTTTA